MTYANENAGRDDIGASIGGRDDFWTYEAVLERLVEAMQLWRRAHDAEARFSLGGRISSIWRQAWTDRAELALIEQLDMKAEAPKPLPLGRADVGRMTEASEWIAFVPERDRRMVMLALGQLASGKLHVGWIDLWKRLGRGKPGPDGLRWRFDQAVQRVATALNRRETA
jgi:hypothetical protein